MQLRVMNEKFTCPGYDCPLRTTCERYLLHSDESKRKGGYYSEKPEKGGKCVKYVKKDER